MFEMFYLFFHWCKREFSCMFTFALHFICFYHSCFLPDVQKKRSKMSRRHNFTPKPSPLIPWFLKKTKKPFFGFCFRMWSWFWKVWKESPLPSTCMPLVESIVIWHNLAESVTPYILRIVVWRCPCIKGCS